MRIAFTVLVLIVCFCSIVVLFWHQEYKYSLPTPVPSNYKQVAVGTSITTSLPSGALFLHFYNPDCPCSRFNAKHLKSLIKTYSDSVSLVIVVPSAKAKKKAMGEFGDDHNYVVDDNQQIATSYGVYATPQAVIVDHTNKLYFRGNYNKSRYCTVKATNYAELALLALLNNQTPPVFDVFATESYGCELPQNRSIAQFYFF